MYLQDDIPDFLTGQLGFVLESQQCMTAWIDSEAHCSEGYWRLPLLLGP